MRPTHWIAAVVVAAATLLGTVPAAQANDFAAIAYSPSTRSWSYWDGAHSRSGAENGALNRCNGSDRRVVVWAENGWAALAVNSNGGWSTGWSANSRAEAERIALNGAGCGAHIVCWTFSGR